MPILRDHDPNIGCLALPITALAGFIVVALGAAAVGISAGASSIAGLCGAAVATVIAAVVLRRTRPDEEPADTPW